MRALLDGASTVDDDDVVGLVTVDSRCAMTMVVRPTFRWCSASRNSASDSASSALVASSSSRICALRSMARAIEMRWRWPPDSSTPFSPIRVVALRHGGDEVMRVCGPRRRDHFLVGRALPPMRMLCMTVPSNRNVSWLT